MDLPVPELIGGSQKFLAGPGYAHILCSPKILYAYHMQTIYVCALVFPPFSMEFRVEVVNLQSRERGGRSGSEISSISTCLPEILDRSFEWGLQNPISSVGDDTVRKSVDD